MTRGVPEISLSDYTHGSPAAKAAFADELWRGLKEYGFIILKDHPVSEDLLDQSYHLSREFFARDDSYKRQFMGPGGQRGYTAFGTEHAKDSDAPDLKEFWHVGQTVDRSKPHHPSLLPNVWPDSPEGFKDNFQALYKALEDTGRIMLEALAPKLDLPKHFFDDKVVGGNSILRLLHYPPVPDGADPKSIRAAAHEDINFITLLVAAEGPGLELLDRDGTWLPVITDKGNLVVDVGDMLARMTNDVLPSTTHRVVNPKGAKNESRYSMPFFMHPAPEVDLSCLPSCVGDGAKYPPITAHDFLNQRLREIGLIK